LSTFSSLQLDPQIIKCLDEIGFQNPTPIQAYAIPVVLQGRDLLASAQTGTGKTAAFVLPALHRLLDPSFRGETGPQIVVLVPTRELAMQVAEETKKFSKYMSRVKTVCIYGGVPYPIQKRALAGKYEILVATPGRLIDHMNSGRIDFSNVKMLVLDEADRMLDMGFVEAVEQIAESMPKEKQTLLFSATIDKKIIPISAKLQNDPHQIAVKPTLERQNAIEQKIYYVDNVDHKMKLLDHILTQTEITQAIVFTSTIKLAQELSDRLKENGLMSDALHGDMNQRQRTKTIERLRSGKIQHLVATDVAARGIDISTISLVVNFDLPFVPEDFIHRIGRTARAGGTGSAVSFVSHKERARLSSIEKLLGKKLEACTIAGLEPAARKAPPSRERPFRSEGGYPKKPFGFANAPRRSEGGYPRKRSDFDKGFERSEGGYPRKRPDFDKGYERSEGGFPKKQYGFDKTPGRSFAGKPSFKGGRDKPANNFFKKKREPKVYKD
jgi:superfamily II DNA/RNA helicase